MPRKKRNPPIYIAKCPICGREFSHPVKGLAVGACKRHAWFKHRRKIEPEVRVV